MDIDPSPGVSLGSSGPLTPIRLRDGGGVTMEFRPRDDVTALELGHIMVLLLKLALSREVIPPNWKGFIAQRGLGRHFVTIEPNEDVGV